MGESFMNSFEEASEGGAVKDVAIVATSAMVTTAALAGVAGYRNTVDPSKGMPRWKVGLDAGVMGAGLLGALVLDGAPALAALGAGLAGLCSVTSHYAMLGGGYVAMALGHAGQPSAPANAPNANQPAVKGNGENGDQIHEGGVESMTRKQRQRFEAYLGR